MSIANELSRIQQAKSDLATSIAAKGVTVPAATTIDGYAALVDQIQTGGGGLPYTEVEYLQSDTQAYIDTGLKASGILHIKTYLVDFFSSATGAWPFGGRNAYNNNAYGIFINNSTNKLNVSYNGSTVAFNSYSSYPSSCWVEMKSGSIKVGSTSHTFTAKTFTSSYNVWLFGMNNGGSLAGSSTCKIGTTFIYDGTTMMYLIPVRVGQVGYMYDKISGQLFGNANSTGAFTLGPDVT